METTTRNLTQEELDSYYRTNFVLQVFEYIKTGKTAKFIAKKEPCEPR